MNDGPYAPPDAKCSFCQHKIGDPVSDVREGTVRYIVQGPGVTICDDCVLLCGEILKEKGFGREERQRTVIKWAGDTFGLDAIAPVGRVRRLVEEVVELAQAEGLSLRDIVAVADHVLKKPPGSPAQEVGGIGVCLLAYCASRGISADEEERRELERVLKIDPDHFRRRHNAKADAGIAVRAPEAEPKE